MPLIPYWPWEKSRLFHDAASDPSVDVAALITGARYGKTIALTNEAIRQVIRDGHGNRGPLPRYICIMVAPTYSMCLDVLIPTWFQFWPDCYTLRWSQSEKKLTTIHGAEVQFRTAEKIDRIRGSGPSLICLDEARDMSLYCYQLALARVADRRGKVLLTTTPNGYDWTYDQVELKARENPRIRCYKATAYDNPLAKSDALARLADIIGEDLYEQEVHGRRIRFSGRVYRHFDPNRHIGPCTYDPRYPLCIAVDFNVDPLSACLMHPLGTKRQPVGWQVFDEFVLRNSDTDELCTEITKRYPLSKHHADVLVYPDASGKSGSSSNRGRSDHAILREHFGANCIKANPANPHVRDRINAVNRLMRYGHDKPTDTRLFIDPKCKTLIKGLEQTGYKGNVPDEQSFEGHITAALGYAEHYERPFSNKGLLEFSPPSSAQARRARLLGER